jgi:hypothetical protein
VQALIATRSPGADFLHNSLACVPDRSDQCRDRGNHRARRLKMKNFTIENETNNITIHGSVKEAEAVPNSERFGTEAALAKLAANWPAARLVEIWNSLPGETPVKKFKDRATAVSRIWKAIQRLGETAPAEAPAPVPETAPVPEQASETALPEAVVPASTEPAVPTDVAPHGAVGTHGLRCDVQVHLPAGLEHYRTRPPVDAAEGVAAIRAGLRFLSVAPDRISYPLLAAVYRAALGKVDFSLFLAGPSGSFKTALASLCQQHFGAAMDAKALPAHFDSTASALEALAFTAKDALLVVDDFVPTGGTGDGELQGTAERLFRGAGNHQGRSRMGGSGRLRSPQTPRALVLATGEEVPRGQSLRARMLIVELRPAEVDRALLTECQSAARQGHLAVAMGAFLCWIAGRYEPLHQRLQTRVRELRNRVLPFVSHARLPAALAELQSGWEIWLQFALEAGGIGSGEQVELAQRMSRALDELATRQAPYQVAGDPALLFVALLQSALDSGQAHVADRLGGVPEAASQWGWKRKPTSRKWIACGACIGWTDGSSLYLDSSASYQVAQQAAGLDRFVAGEQTLRRRLHGQGLLVSIDTGRQTLLVRKTLGGCPRHVLHLRASALVGTITENGANLTL